MKKSSICMYTFLSASFCTITYNAIGADIPYGYSREPILLTSNLYVAHKYDGMITQVIEKYVALCLNLERIIGKFNIQRVRQLVFTHPAVIYCYGQIVKQKSVRPLSYLWQAYKDGSVTIDKQKFIYELCHLIALIFEQFLLKITTDLTGQSAQSLNELLHKLQIDLPLDDLIDILEQCYEQLSLVAQQLNQQQITHVRKWLSLMLIIGAILVRYVYTYVTQNHTSADDTANQKVVEPPQS